MLFVVRKTRDETGCEDQRVERSEHKRGNANAGPHCTRILGSARYRSRSAAKLPAIIVAAETNTTPRTMAKSRATIASRNSGPRPGQPTSTSTSREALSNDPREKPNSEISGLIAAGRT